MCERGSLRADADPDGPEAFEGTLMDGLGDEPGSLIDARHVALTEWVKSNPPEVVAARLKELDDALGQMLDTERERELREMTAE